MTKRNPYLQHTYESFDQPAAPQRRQPAENNFSDERAGPRFTDRLKSPLFATAALLLTGVAFAAIIVVSYPDNKIPDENLPVITADASPLRIEPTEAGGMEVPHQDSTIFSSIRSTDLQETAPIENLLAQEQPVEVPAADAPVENVAIAAELPDPSPIVKVNDEETPPSEMAAAVTETPKAEDVTKVADGVPPVKVGSVMSIPMKSEKIPPGGTAAAAGEKPTLQAAGSTPETLEYVRSVLEKKNAEGSQQASASDVAASSAAKIEPAAGAATTAGIAIAPGDYFVQLASITAESAAPTEWKKLQKSFSTLSGTDYRVQRADLPKGVFYRIQAGPMSKDSANAVCDAIKAQKPGGCLIVR